jgi:hypothetical protein
VLLVCASLTVPHIIQRSAKLPVVTNWSLFTEVTAFNLFTNAPDRFRASPYQYSVAGSRSVDNRGLRLNQYNARAEWFVPASSGRLAALELAVQRWGPAGINISLARDANGRPGQVLERFARVLPPLMRDQGRSWAGLTLTVQSQTRPQLLAGSKYWLCLEPADPTTFVFWCSTWFPNTDDFLNAEAPGKWKYFPPGPQRPGAEVPAVFPRKWHAKAAFAVTVWAPKEEVADSSALQTTARPSASK